MKSEAKASRNTASLESFAKSLFFKNDKAILFTSPISVHVGAQFYSTRVHDDNKAAAWQGCVPRHATYTLFAMRDLSLFQRFLKMCAVRSGQLFKFSALAVDCDILHVTVREWVKRQFNAGQVAGLYFWRDSAEHEVDLLITRDSQFMPVEMKSGATFSTDWTNALRKLSDLFGDAVLSPGIAYGGEGRYEREGCHVAGWQVLAEQG